MERDIEQPAARLSQRLRAHRLIGLDTSVFITHFEAQPTRLALTTAVLTAVETGAVEAVTSVVTLMELTVRPWQQDEAALARQYEALLVNFPHLDMVEIDRTVARRAAQLRASHRLRPADALQAAAALGRGATALVTNDRDFLRLASLLDIIVLDDFV